MRVSGDSESGTASDLSQSRNGHASLNHAVCPTVPLRVTVDGGEAE
jgi:hypothetical protein